MSESMPTLDNGDLILRIAQLEERLEGHLHDLNNPHQTDARQTGGLTKSFFRGYLYREIESVHRHLKTLRGIRDLMLLLVTFSVAASVYATSEIYLTAFVMAAVCIALATIGLMFIIHGYKRRWKDLTDQHSNI